MDNNDIDIETADVREEAAAEKDAEVLAEEDGATAKVDTARVDARAEAAVEKDAEVLAEEDGAAATVDTATVDTAQVDTAKVDTTKDVAPTDDTADTSASGEEREDRSRVVPIAVGVFLVAAIAAVVILVLTNLDDPQDGTRRAGGRGGAEQGEWKVTSYSVGGNHPTGKHAKPPEAQARSLEQLVRRWHDSVYLFPGDLRADTQKYFSKDAAAAVRRSGLGPPENAREVETKKRTARIGIEADGAKRAAAVVDIVARGESAKGAFRTSTETHLWLERRGSTWKVIAFDVAQRPLPVEPRKDASKRDRPGNADGGVGKGAGKGEDGKGKDGGKGNGKPQKGAKK